MENARETEARERPPIDPSALDTLAGAMRGRLVRPDDADYDAARSLWNAMIDRRPAVIARCSGVGDVRKALAFAREQQLPVVVKAAGHSVAGRSIADDAFVIDLSAMDWVYVDPEARTARVGPGAIGRDLDYETQSFTLATTGGTDSTTGVIGLTLGGGMGFLARRYGLAVDNLVSADVVLADGRLVRAGADENEDLFWAIRGGGGSLGIVTSIELRLHAVGPQLFAAQVFHPFEAAGEVLRFYRDFVAQAPDEVMAYAVAVNTPPVDPFPEAHHGRTSIALVVSHCGTLADGEAALDPVKQFGDPIFNLVVPMPYVALQQAFEAGLPAGARYFWKSQYLRELPDTAIGAFIEHVEHLPGPYSNAYFERLGGAIQRIDPAATAFPHRQAAYNFGIGAGWDDPANDEKAIAWSRSLHDAMMPWSTGGTFANYAGSDDRLRSRTVFGANYERLAAIKSAYDPDGVFGRWGD